MPTGKLNTLCDVTGLKVGHAQDERVNTGVSLVLPGKAAIAAVDVRGGGPGTRETDALNPVTLVDRVDALVLTGGSVYGLGAADRVAALLGAQRRGFSLIPDPTVPVSPIVPAAVLYDLNNGGDKGWGETPPYGELAASALTNLSADEQQVGPIGAGYGAMAGAYPGGLGTASWVLPTGQTVAAMVAVNSFGSPYVPGTRQFWAAPWEQGDEFGGRGVASQNAIGDLPPDTKIGSPAGANTTIAIIATDAPLTVNDAQRIAIMAQDGMARAIRPAHGPTDGDTVFVISTGGEPPQSHPLTTTLLGNAAGDVLARAIARAVYASEDASLPS